LKHGTGGTYPSAIYLLHELYIGVYAYSFGDGVFAWVVHVITKILEYLKGNIAIAWYFQC